MPSTPCIVAFCKKRGCHKYPKNEARQEQWQKAIKHIKPGLILCENSKICSDHFKPSDFFQTALSMLLPKKKPNILKRTAIPSIFPWKSAEESASNEDVPVLNLNNLQRTYARTHHIKLVKKDTFISAEESDYNVDPLSLSTRDTEPHEHTTSNNDEIDQNVIEDSEIPFQKQQLQYESTDQSVQTEDIYCGFSVQHYENNDKAIHFYTGLENFNKLKYVFSTLGQYISESNYFYGPPPKHLNLFEQFFITLSILRRHTSYEEIAIMYQVSIKQIYNIFITWIQFMSDHWRNFDQSDDEEETESETSLVPLNIHDECPSTPDLSIEKPKSQQDTNRNICVVKVLIGITHSGMISYVTPIYNGSVTEKKIIENRFMISRFEYTDEILVKDKALSTRAALSHYVKINMPSFFKEENQTMVSQPPVSDQIVDNKKAHIERISGLFKTYRILCQPMNQTEMVLSSDIVFICAMIVNFQLTNKYT